MEIERLRERVDELQRDRQVEGIEINRIQEAQERLDVRCYFSDRK